MEAVNGTEIMLRADRKPEAEEVLQLISELTPAEQQEMLTFMQGVRFAKGLRQQEQQAVREAG